jgi:PIN domain nuclease of toxin-antitoxin system
MKEREHIISLLEHAKIAAKKEDVVALRRLSDQTTHSSAIYQDEDNILVAVTIYSISKIIEKGKKYYKESYQNYLKKYLAILNTALKHLKKGEEKKFRDHIKIQLQSKDLSSDLKMHMQSLFRKGKINKAGKIYEHGISMQKTAKLLGISIWELAEYVGSTQKDIKQSETVNVKKRLRLAQEMFS